MFGMAKWVKKKLDPAEDDLPADLAAFLGFS
jgi:hypothetical protein